MIYSGLFIGLGLGAVFLALLFLTMRHFHKTEIQIMRNQAMLSDLELATTEQLLKEFRDRPKNSYILITPIDEKLEAGLKVELNHIDPFNGLEILHVVTSIITKEMKTRGMAVPKVPEQFEDPDFE